MRSSFQRTLLFSGLLAACASEPAPPRGVVAAPNEASPDAMEISPGLLDAAEIDETGTTITIPTAGHEAELAKIHEGSVLSGMPTPLHPDGLFVVVVEITTNAGNTILVVEEASVEDALADGSLLQLDLGTGDDAPSDNGATLQANGRAAKLPMSFQLQSTAKVTRAFERGALSFENVRQFGSIGLRISSDKKVGRQVANVNVDAEFSYEGGGNVALTIDSGRSHTTLAEELAQTVAGRGSVTLGNIRVPYQVVARAFGVCSFDGNAISYTDSLRAYGSPKMALEWRDDNWLDVSPTPTAIGADPSNAVFSGEGALASSRCALPLEFYVTFGGGQRGPTLRLSPVTQIKDGKPGGGTASTRLAIEYGGAGGVIGRALRHIPSSPSTPASVERVRRAVHASVGTRAPRGPYVGTFEGIDFNSATAIALGITAATVGDDTPAYPSLDLVAANRLGPIRDQGRCKAGWAFATATLMEASSNQKNGTTSTLSGLNLSEQDLVACVRKDSAYPTLDGCRGGSPDDALSFARATGLRPEAVSPYRADNPSRPNAFVCRAKEAQRATIGAWGRLAEADTVLHRPSVLTIKDALLRRGPLVTTLSVTEAFMNADEDPISDRPKGAGKYLHNVLIVGWDDARHAWKVRNSWSPEWGKDGYAWVRWDALNIGMYTAWADAVPFAAEPPSRLAFNVMNLANGDWPSVRTSAVRIWDVLQGDRGTSWSRIETAKGQYDWSALDAAVENAEAHGATEISYVISGTPSFYATSEDASDCGLLWDGNRDTNPKAPGLCSAPWVGKNSAAIPTAAGIDAFVDFARALAKRYRGRITAYEIWNEPSLAMFWRGGEWDKLATMTKRASAAIHEKGADPSALILSASLVPREKVKGVWAEGKDLSYLTALKAVGWPVDVFNVHGYPEVGTVGPDRHDEQLAEVKKVLRKLSAPNRPLWETEHNYNVAGPGNPLPPPVAAEQVARSYLSLLLGKTDQLYWYAWDHGDVGTFGEQFVPASPASAVAEQMQLWLSWVADWKQDDRTNAGARSLIFTTGADAAVIAYAVAGPVPFAKPAGLTYMCTAGSRTCEVAPETLTLTGVPVLFSTAKPFGHN